MNLDINSLQNKYNEVKDDGKGGSFLENFVRMPRGKGSVTLRLLPPAPKGMFGRDSNPFFQHTRIHRVNNKSLHDPREKDSNGKWVGANPIADYLRWLWKESEKASPVEKERMQNLYRQLKPIDRFYYNVIVRQETDDAGNTKTNVGPKILSVGKTVHEIILRGICGDKEMNQEPLGDVTDLARGRDFRLVKTIRKSGENEFPNYEGSHFLDESPAGSQDDWDRWINELHDLSALRVLKTPEELEHELMVHLGIKQDTSSNFDPSKFQKATQEQVKVDVQPESQSSPAPHPQQTPQPPQQMPQPPQQPQAPQQAESSMMEDQGADDTMADEDFLRQLNDA